MLTASSAELERGEAFELVGRGFVCNDVFYNGEPVHGQGVVLPVVLEQGGESLRVGDVEVADDGTFTAELVAPDDAATGTAQLVIDGVSLDVTVM